MRSDLFADLPDKIDALPVSWPVGYVASATGNLFSVTHLSARASLGDRVEILGESSPSVWGEVVQITSDLLWVTPDGPISGLSVGTPVMLHEPLKLAPCEAWLGRVIDANGYPLDDKPLKTGPRMMGLKRPPPSATQRGHWGARLRTGSAALNTFLPIVAGQRIGLFAGSGVGKSTLMGTLVQNVDCDVIVVALIGERGREVRHFVDQILTPEGRARSIVVAATSDKSALERRRSAWTAMTIAEYFRDHGKSVLLLADSITRFAEAHREIATATGEVPVLRGHPPSTTHLITELCERAGPGAAGQGMITTVMSVLVQGSDMDEPIADILRGVLDGHLVLNRAIAERGRYPAIDLLKSVSRSLPDAASADENKIISQIRALVSTYEENSLMVRSGLYTEGSDPDLDQALRIWPEIDKFLGSTGPTTPEQDFDKLRLALRRAASRNG